MIRYKMLFSVTILLDLDAAVYNKGNALFLVEFLVVYEYFIKNNGLKSSRK